MEQKLRVRSNERQSYNVRSRLSVVSGVYTFRLVRSPVRYDRSALMPTLPVCRRTIAGRASWQTAVFVCDAIPVENRRVRNSWSAC